MPRHLRHLCGAVAGMVLLVHAVGCGGTWSGIPKPAPAQAIADTTRDTLPTVALDTPGPGEALVYVFNVSGGTLFGSPRLAVNVDGKEVAALSRETYTTLGLAPGGHLWYVAGGKLELTLEAGRTYFVACAYDLGAILGWLTVDPDAKVREIEEAAARMLLRTYSFAARDAAPAVVLDTPGPGEALVYVFNAEGWTLLGSNEHDVEVDGNTVARLPRKTYTTLAMAPGQHVWRVAGRKLKLTVDAGQTYFLALGHYSREGLAGLFDGDVFELREVDEATARVMLRTYRFQAGEESRKIAAAARAETASLERDADRRSRRIAGSGISYSSGPRSD